MQQDSRELEEALVDAKTICTRLGITIQNLYWLSHAGKIPVYRVGRKLRFRWSEILKDFKRRQK